MKTYTIKRDGKTVVKGLESFTEVVAWIHNHHCYSFEHAIRYEGYEVVRDWMD